MEYDLFLNWFKNYHIDKKKSEEDFLKNKEYLLPRILWHRLYWFNGKWTKCIFENSYYAT